MYKIAFDKEAEKEFLKLDSAAQKLVSSKTFDLKDGNFRSDKLLKGKHKGKFRKRAGKYRIVYLKEDKLLVISLIRLAHKKEVY